MDYFRLSFVVKKDHENCRIQLLVAALFCES